MIDESMGTVYDMLANFLLIVLENVGENSKQVILSGHRQEWFFM